MVSDRYLEWDVRPWEREESSQVEPDAVLRDRLTWPAEMPVGLLDDVHFEEGRRSPFPSTLIDSAAVSDRLLTLGIRGFVGHPLVSPSFVRSLVQMLANSFGQAVLELRVSDETAAREPRVKTFLDELVDEGAVESVKESQWVAELRSQDVLARAAHLVVGSDYDYMIRFGEISFADHDATALFLVGPPDALEEAFTCVQQAASNEGFELRPLGSF